MIYDIAVIGLGAHGSSILYQLSKKYPHLNTIGIEKYSPGNVMGSSGGLSRIIRKAYFESPAYVALVSRSYDLYRELEADLDFIATTSPIEFDAHPLAHLFIPGNKVLHITGGLDIGPSVESVMVSGALAACKENNLSYELLDANAIHTRWPMISLPNDQYVAVYQPDGGFLEPEKCNFAFVKAAVHYGAQTMFNTSVIDIIQNHQDDSFIIQTESTRTLEIRGRTDVSSAASNSEPQKSIQIISKHDQIISKKVILCTGPWIQDSVQFSCLREQNRDDTAMGKIFSKLDSFFHQDNTQVQRQVVNWHDIKPTEKQRTPYDSPNFPIFLIQHQFDPPVPALQIPHDASPNTTSPLVVLSSNTNNVASRDERGNLHVDPSNTNQVNDKDSNEAFYYGFPSMRPGDNSMKIGLYHHLFENQCQDSLNREITFQDVMCTAQCVKSFFPLVKTPDWYDDAKHYLSKKRTSTDIHEKKDFFPLLSANTSFSAACTFTNTFDGHFLIQPLSLRISAQQKDPTLDNQDPNLLDKSQDPNFFLNSICSGHGFKFGAVIGEICAHLAATGFSPHPIDWLSVDRVALNP